MREIFRNGLSIEKSLDNSKEVLIDNLPTNLKIFSFKPSGPAAEFGLM